MGRWVDFVLGGWGELHVVATAASQWLHPTQRQVKVCVCIAVCAYLRQRAVLLTVAIAYSLFYCALTVLCGRCCDPTHPVHRLLPFFLLSAISYQRCRSRVSGALSEERMMCTIDRMGGVVGVYLLMHTVPGYSFCECVG